MKGEQRQQEFINREVFVFHVRGKKDKTTKELTCFSPVPRCIMNHTSHKHCTKFLELTIRQQVFLKALKVYLTMSVSNREALEQWATLGLREPKAFRSVTSNQPSLSFFFFFNLAGSSLLVYVCLCDTLQGIKGALGDPGLPGPTGIRGEFGERVSLTRVPPY